MRKICVQEVLGVWIHSVGNIVVWGVECISMCFYPVYTTSVRRSIHSFFSNFSSVKEAFMPTIHTPYKEQKYLTLNILVLSISGELL